MYLRNKPINSITSIIENYAKTGGDDTIASGDYDIFSTEGVVRFDGASPTVGFLNLKVTYQPGYDTSDWDTDAITTTFGDVPNDLEMAVVVIATKSYLDSKKGDGRIGISSKSRGAESVSFVNEVFQRGLPDEAQEILDHYVMAGI